jgi:hypothetical protein
MCYDEDVGLGTILDIIRLLPEPLDRSLYDLDNKGEFRSDILSIHLSASIKDCYLQRHYCVSSSFYSIITYLQFKKQYLARYALRVERIRVLAGA